jgi:hypothetical protein
VVPSNFIFIEHNIDISSILQQVKDSDDWNTVSGYANIGGKLAPSGFLPLVMGVLAPPFTTIKDSEYQENTPLYDKYTEIRKWLQSKGIQQTSRAAFFKLPPKGLVEMHIDEGKYYLGRDRYHLSLQGEYLYEVAGERHLIKPGTFFWFDNKKMHRAFNSSDIDRITFVFDVPKSNTNPHHRAKLARML